MRADIQTMDLHAYGGEEPEVEAATWAAIAGRLVRDTPRRHLVSVGKGMQKRGWKMEA